MAQVALDTDTVTDSNTGALLPMLQGCRLLAIGSTGQYFSMQTMPPADGRRGIDHPTHGHHLQFAG